MSNLPPPAPSRTEPEPAVLEEHTPGYYSHAEYCGNCGERNTRYILKGCKLEGLGCDCNKCGVYIRFKAAWPADLIKG